MVGPSVVGCNGWRHGARGCVVRGGVMLRQVVAFVVTALCRLVAAVGSFGLIVSLSLHRGTVACPPPICGADGNMDWTSAVRPQRTSRPWSKES